MPAVGRLWPSDNYDADDNYDSDAKDTTSSLQSTLSKNQTKMHMLSKVFQPYFTSHRAGNMSVYSVKSRFWTNEELSLMVAWSSSVSISHSKVQSSIGHLVTCNTGGKEKYQDIEAHF